MVERFVNCTGVPSQTGVVNLKFGFGVGAIMMDLHMLESHPLFKSSTTMQMEIRLSRYPEVGVIDTYPSTVEVGAVMFQNELILLPLALVAVTDAIFQSVL